MEFVASDLDLSQFLIGHFDSSLIGVGIQLGVNREAGSRSGRGNEIYDRLETAEWFAAPVLADVGEEAMFDLVPLAGAGAAGGTR